MKTYITALALMLALCAAPAHGSDAPRKTQKSNTTVITSGGGNTVTVGKGGNGSTVVKDNNGNTVTVGGKGTTVVKGGDGSTTIIKDGKVVKKKSKKKHP